MQHAAEGQDSQCKEHGECSDSITQGSRVWHVRMPSWLAILRNKTVWSISGGEQEKKRVLFETTEILETEFYDLVRRIVSLVFIFRCSSTTTNPVCERRVNLLVYSLSLHRHSYIGFILAFASSIHNKQTNDELVYCKWKQLSESTCAWSCRNRRSRRWKVGRTHTWCLWRSNIRGINNPLQTIKALVQVRETKCLCSCVFVWVRVFVHYSRNWSVSYREGAEPQIEREDLKRIFQFFSLLHSTRMASHVWLGVIDSDLRQN